MSVTRILVLTSSTGGGHDARALAFERWVRKLYGWEVEVRVEQMLEDSSRLARFGVRLYNVIQRRAPWAHHPYYVLVEGLSLLNRGSVFLGGKYYREMIGSFRPHLVFSVHDCLNRGYFQVARQELGGDRVRCATYCSEFSGGYGYSRNWVEPTVDLYVSRTQTALDYATSRLGLAPERAMIGGQFLLPRAYEEVLDSEESQRFLAERLGLATGKRTVLLATGGAGANNHLDLLETLLPHAESWQAIVICGRNKRVANEVGQWAREHPAFSCHVEGFTRDMHLFMQVADVLVTRGGSTTCAEALHFGLPIVFNGLGGIMPQERLTVKYFVKGEAAVRISKAGELGSLIADWTACPERFEALKARLRGLRFGDEAEATVRRLVELAKAAAAVERQARGPERAVVEG